MPKFEDYPDFTPNKTPRQMFQMGVFGGTYWRSIHSNITNRTYDDKQYKKFDFLKDLPPQKMNRPMEKYDVNINFYKAKASSSLDLWETKKWIVSQDPYGWVQWYCNFYTGRRTPDDARQIQRWKNIAGPNGRFYRMLVNLLKKNKDSNKIRQVLLHWAITL